MKDWARACFHAAEADASIVLIASLVYSVIQQFHESGYSRQEGVLEGGVWG